MKGDWRECGEIVRERGRRFLSDYAIHQLQHVPSSDDGDSIQDVPVAWLASVFVSVFDPSHFVEPRLSPQELEVLWASVGSDDGKPGRPRNDTVRAAATLACYFYNAWRAQNKKCGIQDYGHRLEMRDYAAQAIVEDFFSWQWGTRFEWQLDGVANTASYIEIVRVLMDKPKSRREPGSDARLDFRATKAGLHFPPKPL